MSSRRAFISLLGGAQHRQQSNHGSRLIGLGRLGRSPDRLRGQFGQLNLSARASDGGFWRWQWRR